MKEAKQGTLMFVPSGGLANRMRAVASACHLARQTGVRVQVVWFEDWALKAPFHQIFKPITTAGLDIREASLWDYVANDRPRTRNLRIPRLFQAVAYQQRIDEWQVTPLKRQGFDFCRWAAGRRSYMSCYQVFGSFPTALYGELFHPVDEVMGAVEAYKARFSPHTIGVHIRRTDHGEAIARSPLSLFVEAIDREVSTHRDTTVFLATDDEATKAQLVQRYGNRIVTPPSQASRGSVDGIRGGLADMYALASTSRIYGSAGSSFSEMASYLFGTPLSILSL